MIGTTIANRYKFDSEMGRGGTGIVYKGHDLLLDRDVAIKVIKTKDFEAEGNNRLFQEARMIAHLNHPNIVTIFDAGEVNDFTYIVMELVEGCSLHDQPPKNVNDMVRIMRLVCAGLSHAHENGIIHRDLKPENIIVSPDGRVRLMDFGVARTIASRLKADGVIGTVYYLAPEQALGQAIDNRADLYALGVILYELSTGQLPFGGPDPVSVITQHLHSSPIPPSAITPKISRALESLILQLLSKRPENRPVSADEVRRRLETLNQQSILLSTEFTDEPTLARIARGRIVGRSQEIAEMLSVWKQVLNGQADEHVLLVSGEPGVGKTRLVQEFLTRAAIEKAVILTGACYDEGSSPYAPLAQILRNSFENFSRYENNLADETIRNLLPIMPSLRNRFSHIQVDQQVEQVSEQQRAYEGFLSFCTFLCAQGPVLLFIDDIHWADTSTLSLLRNLARRAKRLPLLILMAYRSTEVESAPEMNRVLSDLNREHLSLHFHLEHLNRDDTLNLLATLFGETITPDFLDGIFQKTEGNPFFIEEVCKSLIETRQLFYKEGSWHRLAMTEIKIPQSVQSAILARLDKFPAEAQEVLMMAAVLGSDFDYKTLKQACNLEEEALIGCLERAEKAQLISEVQSNPEGVLNFRFAHGLIPTTIRESTIHVRRRKLHLKAARAIETVHPEDFELLAYQYSQAGEVDRARQFYMLAGDRARSAAPDEAVRFYKASLKHWPSTKDQANRANIIANLGYCLWVIDNIQESLQCYQTAYTLYDQLGNRTQSGEMQRMIGRIYWQQADRPQSIEHYYKALSILEQEPETTELASAIGSISQILMLTHDNEQGIVWGERALRMAQSLGSKNVVSNALNNIGSCYAQLGEFEKGIPFMNESLETALNAGLPQDASRAYYNLGVLYQRQCRYQEAEDIFRQLHAYSTRVYTRSFGLLTIWRLMWINWCTGRWKVALDFRSQLDDSGDTLFVTWKKKIFGLIDIDLGLINEALLELEDSLPAAIRADEFQTTVPHWGQLARAYAGLGEEEKMLGAIHKMLDFITARTYQSNESIMPVLYACQLSSAQKTSEGLELAHACLAQLERLAHQYHTEEAEAAMSEGRGCILFASGQSFKSIEQFRQANSNWEKIERRFDQARTLGYLGRSLGLDRDIKGARDAYRHALNILTDLSNQLKEEQRSKFLDSPMVCEIRTSYENLAHSRRRNPKRLANDLTGREVEVLNLVSKGMTNAQIAKLLTLSPLTVNAHLRSIFNKLDVTSRTAAVRLAMEKGLV